MREMNEEQLETASVAFAMAAQFVGAEPSCEWLKSCRADDLFDEAPFASEDEGVARGLSLMRSYVRGLGEDEVSEAAAALGREWLRLFVGVGAPDAPVWESFYVEANSPMMSKATLEVRSLFQKYDISLARQGSEPDDALGPMLAFCSHVQHCEVAALQEGLQEEADVCRGDLDSFISQHLLPWIAAWKSLVEEYASSDYFRGVGLFVFGLLRCYVRRFAIRWDEAQGRFMRAAGGVGGHPSSSRFDVEALSSMASKVSHAADLVEAAEVVRKSKMAQAAAMAAVPGLAKGQAAGVLATKAAVASAGRVAQVAAEGALKVVARHVADAASSAVEVTEGAADAVAAEAVGAGAGVEGVEDVLGEQVASPSKGGGGCAEACDESMTPFDLEHAESNACGDGSDAKGRCVEKE